MSDKLDELAGDVDNALESVEALAEDPGGTKSKQIDKVKDALDTAKSKLDEMEDDQESDD